jgi:4-amino-4-deoxy-L-arabinose transferase-like glycosyltransferase
MKKAVFVALLSFTTLFAIAQTDTTYRQLPVVAIDNVVVFLTNEQVLIQDLAVINPQNIKHISVLKDKASIPESFKNLGKYGVILVTTKKKVSIATRRFAEVKEWFHINEPVQYALNGFYVDDENLQLATASINEVNIFRKGNEFPVTVINIWTLLPKQRNGMPHGGRKPTDKPGVIYIRGNK